MGSGGTRLRISVGLVSALSPKPGGCVLQATRSGGGICPTGSSISLQTLNVSSPNAFLFQGAGLRVPNVGRRSK